MHTLRPKLLILALSFVTYLQVPAHATDVQVQGGPGGQYARLLCPPDFFLQGVEVTLASWVTSIRGKCLKYDPTTQRFGGAPQFTNLHGVPGGAQGALACKDDQYVQGIQIGFTRQGNSPRYLDYIQINCVDLTDTAIPPAVFSHWLPTRLGDGTVTVAVKNVASPFTGQEIKALPVPGRWLRRTVLPEEPVKAVDGQLRIGTRAYTYDRLGIRRLRADHA
jgi:hypothetical protein